MPFTPEHHEIEWEGIALSISAETPYWCNSFEETYGVPMVHLEIRSEDSRPLPITETGYRSEFIRADSLAEHGGVLAYVFQWMEAEAAEKRWTKEFQLSLF